MNVKKSQVDVWLVEFTAADIRRLHENDRAIFLICNQITNELGILLKTWAAICQGEITHATHDAALVTQGMIVMRLLAAKLYEAASFLKRYCHQNSRTRKKYSKYLEPNVFEQLDERIHQVANRKGIFSILRNKTSFHHDFEFVAKLPVKLDDLKGLHWVLSDSNINTFARFSEDMLMARALESFPADMEAAKKQFAVSVSEAVSAVTEFTTELSKAIVQENFPKIWAALEIEAPAQVDATDIEKLSLPIMVRRQAGRT